MLPAHRSNSLLALSRRCQIFIRRRSRFLDKPVQRNQVLAVKAEQHARRPFSPEGECGPPTSRFPSGGTAAFPPATAIAPAAGLPYRLALGFIQPF